MEFPVDLQKKIGKYIKPYKMEENILGRVTFVQWLA